MAKLGASQIDNIILYDIPIESLIHWQNWEHPKLINIILYVIPIESLIHRQNWEHPKLINIILHDITTPVGINLLAIDKAILFCTRTIYV